MTGKPEQGQVRRTLAQDREIMPKQVVAENGSQLRQRGG